MMIWIGVAIIGVAIYFLAKQYETRMVLFTAGFLMALVAGDPLVAFKSFSHAMGEYKLFETIVTVMGFSMVMKLTKCDQHLIHFMAKPVQKAGPLLIPAATFVTFFINSTLTSAAGSAAAAGAILIPLLLSSGVHPAVAAAAVLAGTFGSMFNPGYAMNALTASVAKASPVAVVANHFVPLLIVCTVVAMTLGILAYIRKENKGWNQTEEIADEIGEFKVSYLKALVPIVPLILILIASSKVIPALKGLAISHTMIIGSFIAFLVSRGNPGKITKEFFHGIGEAYGHICGIIICALVFVDGMKALGMLKALTDAMIAHPEIAKFSTGFGPYILGVISGSGDAAATAFNKAVTINAAQFNMNPLSMGSLAVLGGALGRAMSPLAGAAIICATYANVSPMDVAKRNALGMFLGCLVGSFLLVF